MAWPVPPYDFTVEEIAQLRAAYVSGASRVTIGDRDISFRSLAELEAIITASNPIVKSTRGLTFITDKGL